MIILRFEKKVSFLILSPQQVYYQLLSSPNLVFLHFHSGFYTELQYHHFFVELFKHLFEDLSFTPMFFHLLLLRLFFPSVEFDILHYKEVLVVFGTID